MASVWKADAVWGGDMETTSTRSEQANNAVRPWPAFRRRFNIFKWIVCLLCIAGCALAVGGIYLSEARPDVSPVLLRISGVCFVTALFAGFGWVASGIVAKCPGCGARLLTGRKSLNTWADSNRRMIVRCPECNVEWNTGVLECPE